LASGSAGSTVAGGAASSTSPWSNYGMNASASSSSATGGLATSYPTTPFPAASIPSSETTPPADNSLAPYPPGPSPNAYTSTPPSQFSGQAPYGNTTTSSETLAETPAVQSGPYGSPAGIVPESYGQQALGGMPSPPAAPVGVTPYGQTSSLPGYRTADARQAPMGADPGSMASPSSVSPYESSDVGSRYSSPTGPLAGDPAAAPSAGSPTWGSNPGVAQSSEPMPPYHTPETERGTIAVGNPMPSERLSVVPTQPTHTSPPATVPRSGSPPTPNRFRPGGTSDYLGQPRSSAVYPSLSQETVPGSPAHQATSYQLPPVSSPPPSAGLPPSSSFPSGAGSHSTVPSSGGSGRF
jgi:hypothetical protein